MSHTFKVGDRVRIRSLSPIAWSPDAVLAFSGRVGEIIDEPLAPSPERCFVKFDVPTVFGDMRVERWHFGVFDLAPESLNLERFYMETPCTSESPRQPDNRIPTMKLNVFEAESLERACELAQTFWETQGYYVIGPSIRIYNQKTQR